jgi:hypothetical protein
MIKAALAPGAGGKVPAWVNVLSAADAWGIPPWEVRGQEATPAGRVLWLTRKRAWDEEVRKRQALDNGKAANKK